MLAASWAVVYSPWIPTVRTHLGRGFISRSFSQSSTKVATPLLSTSRHPPNYSLFGDSLKESSVVLRSYHTSQLTYADVQSPMTSNKEESSNTAELEFEIQPDGHSTTAPAPVDSAVFEDTLDDYSLVNSESTRPPPSILNLVTQTLPEVLPPPKPNDDMVFEDEFNHDYETHVAINEPSSISQILAQLVKDDQYDEAYRLLLEIQDLDDIHISHSQIYEKAALATLGPSLSTSLDQITKFTSWLSLIPSAHLAESPSTFDEIRWHIFGAKFLNTRLAIRFTTLLASKGYADLIITQAIPPIMHFSPHEVSFNFIVEFEKKNEVYWRTFKPEEAPSRTSSTMTKLRGAAIRSLTYSGQFEMAISLLPDPKLPTFKLTKHTYDVLIGRIEVSKDSAIHKHIPFIQTLRDQGSTSIGISARDALDTHANAQSGQLGPDIPVAIKYLRAALESRDNLPHVTALANFINEYISSGRKRRSLSRLRGRALRNGHSANMFLLAEMLYYRQQGLDELVIQTFVDHFYVVGVPLDNILYYYDRAQQQQTDERSLHIKNGKDSTKELRKYWPKHTHCSLVWHALLSLAPSRAAVDQLYQNLVRFAMEDGVDLASTQADDVEPLLPPPSWGRNVAAAAFTPFIRRLMLMFGSSRGAVVLNDMLKAGLKPTLHHFTELAGIYASLGDARRALMILGRMEDAKESSLTADSANLNKANILPAIPAEPSFKPSDSPSDTEHQAAGDQKEHDPSFPAPDIVMYTSILRGFIISKNLWAIEEVARRLKRHHRYIPGENAYLDAVHADIQLLREEVVRPKLSYFAYRPQTT